MWLNAHVQCFTRIAVGYFKKSLTDSIWKETLLFIVSDLLYSVSRFVLGIFMLYIYIYACMLMNIYVDLPAYL